MYLPDARTKVLELPDAPAMDVGAPVPFLFAAEHALRLCYYLPLREAEALPAPQGDAEWYAVVDFLRPLAHLVGPPNDEALHGHPLHDFGLEAYGAFEVRSSPWIAQLEEMNRVHRSHDASRYATKRHYIFTFHDSTFECVAESLTADRRASTPEALLGELLARQSF